MDTEKDAPSPLEDAAILLDLVLVHPLVLQTQPVATTGFHMEAALFCATKAAAQIGSKRMVIRLGTVRLLLQSLRMDVVVLELVLVVPRMSSSVELLKPLVKFPPRRPIAFWATPSMSAM